MLLAVRKCRANDAQSSDLRPEERQNIIERKQRIGALQRDKADLMRQSGANIASQAKIMYENSSWNPWASFTVAQQQMYKEASHQKIDLIRHRTIELKRIEKETEILDKQIQIIERHGIPETFDVLAMALGLPRAVLQKAEAVEADKHGAPFVEDDGHP